MTERAGTSQEDGDTDRALDGLFPNPSGELGDLYRKELSVGLALLDSELRYVCVNTRLAEINGRPVEAHIGRTIHEVVPGLAEELVPLCRRVLESGDSVVGQEVMGATPAQPGVLRHWLVDHHPVRSHDGTVLEINVVVQESTLITKALAEIRAREERFRSTFEQAAVGIAHVAPDGTFLRINRRFCDIVGFSREEMLTRTFQDITHPDDLDADLEYVRQVLADEIKTYSMEKRYFKKDGEVVWINLTVSLLREDNGEPRYFIAVVEDISERKEAEDLLGKSQAIAHIGNWSIKRGEEIVVCSDEVCHIFGLPIGSTVTFEMFNEVIHPEDREYVKSSWMTALNHKQFDFTYRILVDGQLKWVAVKAESTFHEEDETTSAIGTVQDITKRKEAEDRFGLLVEQAGDAFFVLDYDGVISDINRQAYQGLGYSREELLGMKISDVDTDVEGKQHRQRFWNSLKPGQHITFEGVHRRKDGSSFPVEVRLGQLDLGENRFLLALARDITERKQKEEKLKRHGEFQELVSRISSEFTGLSGVEFEQAIQDSLAEIGRYFASDTVRLYRLSLQGDVLKIRNMWRDEGLSPPEEMGEIHKMTYPNLAAHYSKGESTVFCKYDDSPPWPEMRKILKFFGTEAGVGVPLESDSVGVDVFAMDKIGAEHVWPEGIVEQSKAIGKVILNAMRRREAEAELQDSYNEVRALKDRLEQENVYLQREISLEHRHGEIIGGSTALSKVLNKVEQVASTDSTVLILGETGTGKELLARAIHSQSKRKARTMVKVNCAALPSTLIESELFGREKGAYTGALTEQAGRFEVAHGSTIFLDEISELSLDLQAKLLRVLQEGQFERLGNPKPVDVDVRVIAATNRDLAEAVQKGQFRADLYYRLNVFPIAIPPLRERREDIPTLVWHFVPEFAEKMGKRIESIPKKTMDALQNYAWPGNVRELRNVIENAMIITTGPVLQVEMPQVSAAARAENTSLRDMERKHILAVLETTDWRVRGNNGAAEILGLKPTTLEARMRKLDIQRK